MRILGAGLAGLLAGVMLRRYNPRIYEAQGTLPNNHSALLRFRTDAVSRVTGIPFRSVQVHKAICYKYEIITRPNLKFSNMYAQKVTGEVESRSISNLDSVERFIAPSNLISLMASGLDIQYAAPLEELGDIRTEEPTISTIPMPALMKIAGWYESVKIFRYRVVTTLTADVVAPLIDVYQTIYYPGPEIFYRASLTGKHLIVEFVDSPELPDHLAIVQRVLMDFGISQPTVENTEVKVREYGKIAPVAEEVRKTFILAMSDQHNIYSLGRYGTWRQILLDDVVGDVSIIDRMINQRDVYSKRLQLT